MKILKSAAALSLVVIAGLGSSACDTLKSKFLSNTSAAAIEPDPVPADTTPATLYERLGSKAVITAVVDEFVIYVGEDSRISPRFSGTDISAFKTSLIDQLCAATGGPCTYKGKDMRETHADMAITDADFSALMEDLVKALDRFKVAAPEQQELLDILRPLRTDIVTA